MHMPAAVLVGGLWVGAFDDRWMPKALPPTLRRKIIEFDPAAPGAVSIVRFCQENGVSRRSFYNIRQRYTEEAGAALHPRSSAPHSPRHKFDQETTRTLIVVRDRLRSAGRDFGPISIRFEAIANQDFTSSVPSTATISRSLRAAGVVDANPKKRPKSTLLRFERSRAMELWQLDAFEYHLHDADRTLVCVYQLLDDATRFDVGTRCFTGKENAADAMSTVRDAIFEFGAPRELLSDNSQAFNQLRYGRVGALEAYLASVGCLAITGRPSRPQTQGKNERGHQTLLRYLRVHQPRTMERARELLVAFREHYNARRPHQALPGHVTPQQAWQMIEHAPATAPLDPSVLIHRARRYRAAREAGDAVYRQGEQTSPVANASTASADHAEGTLEVEAVRITRNNPVVFHAGLRIGVPRALTGRLLYRTISSDELAYWDARSGELVLSIPLPVVAIAATKKYINSYKIRGVYLLDPPKTWAKQRAKFQEQLELLP